MHIIAASVGINSINRKRDVEFIQRLLNIYISSIIPMEKLKWTVSREKELFIS